MTTKLLLDVRSGEASVRGDGILGRAADLSPADIPESELVLLHGSPATSEEWQPERGAYWVVEQGLDAAAKLRQMFPGHRFLPHVQAWRAEVRYGLGEPYQGEGFRVYVPDTAALRGYQVDDGDCLLADWLKRAESMGFDTIMLTGRDIGAAGKGFDFEMLDRAKRVFAGNLIVAGGGVDIRHLETLREEGGCFAAVVPASLVERVGIEPILLALQPPAEAEDTDEVAA